MAICLHKTIKNFNPPEGKAGEVLKTPFQKELRVKVGAKVMLTYNVDTCDGLTNGARGELVGIMLDTKKNISKLVIKFDKESVGREKRRKYQETQKRYPGGTPIEKVNFGFSISKSKKSVINTATVIQFPIKLAFACTAHKIQGSTIPKPQKSYYKCQRYICSSYGLCHAKQGLCTLTDLHIRQICGFQNVPKPKSS